MSSGADESCHRFEWLSENLHRTLTQMQRTLAETRTVTSEQWKGDWIDRRSRVADRLDRIETQLRRLLSTDERIPLRLVGGCDQEVPAHSIGAA